MVKRQAFTPEFKAQVVLEVISGSQSVAEVCPRYSLKMQFQNKCGRVFYAQSLVLTMSYDDKRYAIA